MHISHVKIANFRALEKVAVPLKRCGVLIGESDVGKTSFLYALEKFFAHKKLSDKTDWFKHDTSKEIGIVVTFSDLPKDEELQPFLHEDGSLVLSKVFEFASTPAEKVILPDKSAEKFPVAIRNRWFSSDNFHFIPVRRDLTVQFSMNKTAMLGKLLRKKMTSALQQGETQESLDQIQQILSDALEEPRDALQAYLREQMYNDSVSIGFDDLVVDPIAGVSFDVTLSDDRVEQVLIENRGAGTQNNLIIALFRLIAELQIEESFIFAMEEPENSLHPKAQRQLLSVIQEISSTSQVILTTHSPVFIDRSRFEHNILLTRTAKGNTVAKTFDEDVLGDVRTDLGIRTSDALLKGGGNCAILVEGRTEEDGFPTFMEMAGLSEFQLGIAIINMGGSDSDRASRIAKLLAAYDIPCVIVLDSDAEKTEADLKRLAKASTPNIRQVFRLQKGAIEDYYPLDVVAQVMNDNLSPTTEITPDMFDNTKHGQARHSDFKKVMHENGAGEALDFLKRLLGGQGTKLLKDRPEPLDDEIKAIFDKVVQIVHE